MRLKRALIVAWTASCALSICGATSAYAAPAAAPADSIGAITAATGHADNADSPRIRAQSSAVLTTAGSGSTQSFLGTPDGRRLGVGLAGGAPRTGSEMPSGTLYRDVQPGTDSAIQRTPSGMRMLAVIKDSSAPQSFRFELSLPAGDRLHALPNGTVTIEGADGEVRGGISRAWAFDAHGRPVATHYAVDGDTLVQFVDHRNAAYPVVADPGITFGATSADITLNAMDQRIILSGGGAAAGGLLGGLLCAETGPGAVLCAAGGAVVGTVVFEAIKEYAVMDNCDLIVTVPYIVPPTVTGVRSVCH